jgi:methylase of polypeptide subunit release factors
MKDVRFEPKIALVGGNLGTEVYERFVMDLPGRLTEDGFAVCEVGGKMQVEALGGLMKGHGLHVRSKRDLAGRERVLIGSWKSLS